PSTAVAASPVDDFDALLIEGGTGWQTACAPDLGPLLRSAQAAGKTVGGICDGVLALARAGLLDNVRHTANGPESLPDTGYSGGNYYIVSPRAVLGPRAVTAPRTAPLSFLGP